MLRIASIITFTCVLFALGLNAQIDKQGLPLTWSQNTNTTTNNTWRALPTFDILSLLAEDELDEENKLMPFRFAIATQVNFSTSNSGRWTNYPNGDRLWILAVESSQATNLNVTFGRFNIPQGGKVYVYNGNKTDFIGPLAAKSNGTQEFTILPLDGSKLIIEYYEPYSGRGQGDIFISHITQGYKNLSASADQLGVCRQTLSNANGDRLVNNLSASTALLLVDRGQRITTGSMLNNTRNDGKPLLLTSATSLLGDPENWVIVFGLNESNCGNEQNIDCWDKALSGAEVLSVDQHSGLALLELSEKPRTAWGVFYAGWSSDEPKADNYVAVQHAFGVAQSYSTVQKDLAAIDWLGLQVASVSRWSRGNTFPGSIGSPLYSSSGTLTGAFIGGNSNCSNTGVDYIGLLHTAFPKFRSFLDPVDSEKGNIEGFYPIFIETENREDEMAEIFVFPNPASNFIYIQNESDEEISQVLFYDMSGRVVNLERPNLPTIDVSGLPDGVYELQIISASKKSRARIIVKH